MTTNHPTGASPPAPPMDPAANRATRHLCAGAYLDADYAHEVLRDVDAAHGRAVAPYMGADTAAVLIHARRARVLNAAEATALLIVFVFELCLAGTPVIQMLYVLLLWQWLRLLSKAEGEAPDVERTRKAVGKTLKIVTITFVALTVLTSITFMSIGRSVITDLFVGLMAGMSLGSFLPPLLVLMIVVAVTGAVRGHLIARLRTAPPPQPEFGTPARARERQYARVTVYSGFDPFRDAGVRVRAFKFALDLRPPGTDAPDPVENPAWPEFDVDTLIGHVAGFLAGLGGDYGRFARIPDLRVDHHFVISGRDTPWPDLTDPPYETAVEIMRLPVGAMRHYLKCQVISPDGEVAMTTYVHVALQGRTLYLEFSAHVMPPTRDDFHVFDVPWRTGATGVAIGAAQGISRLPSLLGRVPATLWRASSGSMDTARIKGGLAPVDVGAKASLRLLGAEPGFNDYFQWRDPNKYVTILERQLFVALIDFLRGRVDLAELENRAMTIINNGVVNSGSGSTVNVGVAGSDNSGNTVGTVGTVHGNSGNPA